MIGLAAERLMELGVAGLTGVGYGEKSAERLAQPNGYRDRAWERRAVTFLWTPCRLRSKNEARDNWPLCLAGHPGNRLLKCTPRVALAVALATNLSHSWGDTLYKCDNGLFTYALTLRKDDDGFK